MKVIRHGKPRWPAPGALHGQKLRRWTSHRPALKNVLELAVDHPAVIEGRTIFPSRVFDPADVGRVLIPGENSRKIGGRVTKGLWKGSRIFTLSLEERASCPRSCTHWRTCYLNHMPFTKRLRHGPTLVARIEQELVELTERHPEGVVIRAHISGDFWSTSYVRQWARWLRRFSNLRVFGYTAHPPRSRIGSEIKAVTDRYWSRFAIRFSNSTLDTRAANTIHYQPLNRWSPKGSSAPHRPPKPKPAEPAPFAGAPKKTSRLSPTSGGRPLGIQPDRGWRRTTFVRR